MPWKECWGYDVAPDGPFLVIGDSSPQAEVLPVILKWTEELKRLVPTKCCPQIGGC